MTADEFLDQWLTNHNNNGRPSPDAASLAEELVFAASQNEIDATALEAAAGQNLEDYIEKSIRGAVEEERL